MPPEWIIHARAWLAKADSDLATARLVIEGQNRVLDTGVYHCQQAAEKGLKAWLTTQGTIFPKTHILETLLDLCIESNPSFERYRQYAEALTPLATEFRYPGDVFEPSLSQARQALGMADEILTFIKTSIDKLVPDSNPPKRH